MLVVVVHHRQEGNGRVYRQNCSQFTDGRPVGDLQGEFVLPETGEFRVVALQPGKKSDFQFHCITPRGFMKGGAKCPASLSHLSRRSDFRQVGPARRDSAEA
jgi:hypothetical protein